MSGAASLFYYDMNAFPEERGFWVRGTRQTHVTIAPPMAAESLMLRVHSGPIANRLHIATAGLERDVYLQPLMPQDIQIPAAGRHLVMLTLTAERAFVPGEIDPRSDDFRALGAWIEVAR